MSRFSCTHLLCGLTRSQAVRCLVVSLGVMALLMGVCAQAMADRPSAVDNSTLMYFPPIGGPQEIGDCTCWSSAYYYNTYTQARDEGLDASSGDPNVICSPRFLFALIAQGWWGAECTEHAMARLADVGCAPVSKHSMSAPWTQWPTEAAWVAALNNRTRTLHKIRADDEAGLEAIKQHIADGGLVVTRGDFLSNYGTMVPAPPGRASHSASCTGARATTFCGIQFASWATTTTRSTGTIALGRYATARS